MLQLAFHTSWHEAQKTAKEVWPPTAQPEKYFSQKEASFDFDQKVHETLVTNADIRGQQRLKRSAQPHSCGFITAVPSDEDGKDCLMRPRNFRIAVAYRLGMNVLEEEISCPLCKQLINKFGDHATCCTKSGDLIIRHNSMRNLIADLASDGMLSPGLEKEGILGWSTPGRCHNTEVG